MKKLFIILGVLCALALGGGIYSYSYAYVPASCSTVSGARVTTKYMNGLFWVTLHNQSGSRCSASYKVYGKLSNGTWEYVGSGILTADDGAWDQQSYSMKGYEQMRADEISTWKCN